MPSNLVLALLMSWRCHEELGPHRAVAMPWGEAGSACVGSICRREGCPWHLLFGSSAPLGVKHEQFWVFLQLWRPPSIRLCQSSEGICHARAVNQEMIWCQARQKPHSSSRAYRNSSQSCCLPSLPEIVGESNVIPTYACPEKG